MTSVLATVVDTKALWQTVVAAVVAGVGTTIVFSIAILGATRFAEASRDRRPGEAAIFAALGILAMLATIGAIVVGVIVMTTK
jgi:hypothetical protein